MFFEYPKLLWLLLVPALLVLRYIIIEIKDRRPHLRVSKVVPWKAGGKSVLGIVRHMSTGLTPRESTSFSPWMCRRVCSPGILLLTG